MAKSKRVKRQRLEDATTVVTRLRPVGGELSCLPPHLTYCAEGCGTVLLKSAYPRGRCKECERGWKGDRRRVTRDN